jgi:methionine-rich copper-binding protein CopC
MNTHQTYRCTSAAAIAVAALLLMSLGCAKQTPSAGPGSDNGNGDTSADPSRVFSLGLPRGEVHVSQGSDVKLKVEVNRGSQFMEGVTVSFEPPAGLSVNPPETKVDKEGKNLEVVLMAGAELEPDEYQITVVGRSEDGHETSGKIDITVDKLEAASRKPD